MQSLGNPPDADLHGEMTSRVLHGRSGTRFFAKYISLQVGQHF